MFKIPFPFLPCHFSTHISFKYFLGFNGIKALPVDEKRSTEGEIEVEKLRVGLKLTVGVKASNNTKVNK